MKKDVAPDSIYAYHNLKLGELQLSVIRAIQHLELIGKQAYCESIADYLTASLPGQPFTPNRVSGRLTELRKRGAITYNGNTRSRFNQYQDCYKLVTRDQQSLI